MEPQCRLEAIFVVIENHDREAIIFGKLWKIFFEFETHDELVKFLKNCFLLNSMVQRLFYLRQTPTKFGRQWLWMIMWDMCLLSTCLKCATIMEKRFGTEKMLLCHKRYQNQNKLQSMIFHKMGNRLRTRPLSKNSQHKKKTLRYDLNQFQKLELQQGWNLHSKICRITRST